MAIVVESDVPVAADRTMTWGPTGIGLSLDSGSTAAASNTVPTGGGFVNVASCAVPGF